MILKLLALLIGIIFLLVLIIKFKINTFVSLVLTAVVTAIMLQMPLGNIATSVTNGIGSQLGELSMVFGFGAMLGRLVSDSGGAYMIAETLIKRFGKKRLQSPLCLLHLFLVLHCSSKLEWFYWFQSSSLLPLKPAFQFFI